MAAFGVGRGLGKLAGRSQVARTFPRVLSGPKVRGRSSSPVRPEGRGVQEPFEQLPVGGGELVFAELMRGDPAERRTAQGPGLVLSPRAAEETQMNTPAGIVVIDGFHQFDDINLHAQLLPELTLQALLESLARLALASGELPEPGQMSAGGPLGDEQLTAPKHQAGGHLDGLGGRRHRPTLL